MAVLDVRDPVVEVEWREVCREFLVLGTGLWEQISARATKVTSATHVAVVQEQTEECVAKRSSAGGSLPATRSRQTRG